jgi:hypothetical protein
MVRRRGTSFFKHGVLHVSKKLVAILLASTLTGGQVYAANIDAAAPKTAGAEQASYAPLAPGAAAGVKQAAGMDVDQNTLVWGAAGLALVGGLFYLSESSDHKAGKLTTTTSTTSTTSTTKTSSSTTP